MTDPKRWLEDEGEDPSLRADMRAANEAPPPALDYAAGLEALRTATRGGGGGGAPPGRGGLALGAAGAAIVGVVVLLWATQGERAAVDPPLPAGERVGERGSEVEAEGEVESEPEVESEVEVESEPEVESEVEVESESHIARPHPPVVAPAPSLEPSAELVMREARATREIRTAVESDPARALTLGTAAQAEFGDGSFGEERAALRILALAALHRDAFGEERAALRILALAALHRDAEAHRLGTAFLAAHGQGLYAERVRRAIGAGVPP
jgi:hypothetical protein